MTLIDYFNAFQTVSRLKNFSASARSLYFAILGEFNAAHYPERLQISNIVLQNLSGIQSSHVFNSARCAIINAKLIGYEKNKKIYQLLVPELAFCNTRFSGTLQLPGGESSGNNGETFGKLSGKSLGFIPLPVTPQRERDGERDEDNNKTAATAKTRAKGVLAAGLSEELQTVWQNYAGERLTAGFAEQFAVLEATCGTAEVCNAIIAAANGNKYQRLTFNYINAILENQVKGATPHDAGNRNNAKAGLLDAGTAGKMGKISKIAQPDWTNDAINDFLES